MITINATGDTTIHTANKYCPEDILVKVPAGGSGGGSSSIELVQIAIDDGSFRTGCSGEVYYTTLDSEGNIMATSTPFIEFEGCSIDVVNHSIITIYANAIAEFSSDEDNITFLKCESNVLTVYINGEDWIIIASGG